MNKSSLEDKQQQILEILQEEDIQCCDNTDLHIIEDTRVNYFLEDSVLRTGETYSHIEIQCNNCHAILYTGKERYG